MLWSCEGERHLLPRLLSEVSQRGSSKWECLEAGPSGPCDWYMPCQTWNSEETEADERVISQILFTGECGSFIGKVFDDYCKKGKLDKKPDLEDYESAELDLMHVKMSMVKK